MCRVGCLALFAEGLLRLIGVIRQSSHGRTFTCRLDLGGCHRTIRCNHDYSGAYHHGKHGYSRKDYDDQQKKDHVRKQVERVIKGK